MLSHIRILLLTVFAMMTMLPAEADVPSNYYSSIDGKAYTDLKASLGDIIASHKVLGYASLWGYYPQTYYHLDDKTRVLDMYSDVLRYYNGSAAVSGINREHTVPKSWWGGSTSAAPGNDLFNVIPSDQDANSRKSNYPMGKISSQSWTNGVTTIGSGTVNGYSNTFFEPEDCYKGDFARIYFYMATCYASQDWDGNSAYAMTNASDLTLKSWIIPMLIEWSNNDPVDAAEIQRNEDIYQIQGNRNPFIDYPSLIEYIWGSKTDENFMLSEHQANVGQGTTLYAAIPSFSPLGGTQASPRGVAIGTIITIKGSSSVSTLHVRINDGEWTDVKYSTGYNSSTGITYYTAPVLNVEVNSLTHIEAYCTQDEREPSDILSYWYLATDYTDDYLLYEEFDGVKGGNNTSNTGSSTKWTGNDNFPEDGLQTVYQAGNAIKLGSGSNVGSISTKSLDIAGGNLEVEISLKGWTSVEGQLAVSVTGCQTQTVSYTATMSSVEWETVKLTFENVASNPVVTIATTAKRVFIDKIAIRGVSSASMLGPSILVGSSDNTYYNIGGQRFSSYPTRPGIYIYNGRKIIVR